MCWLDPGALEAAVILQEFFLSEKLAWSSPSAAVVQRLGSLCGIMGNVGFMKCILHKVEASGVHSDTSFEAHVEGTAAHQTVGLLPSPDDCVESHFH